jgi:cold shock CspA family protein
MDTREQGRIISWSDREGRGVIRRAKGPDIEFSFSAIRQEPGSYLGLTVGTTVTFLLVNTDTGTQVQDVAVG